MGNRENALVLLGCAIKLWLVMVRGYSRSEGAEGSLCQNSMDGSFTFAASDAECQSRL